MSTIAAPIRALTTRASGIIALVITIVLLGLASFAASGVTLPDRGSSLPRGAESGEVAERIDALSEGSDSLLVVFSSEDTLDPAVIGQLAGMLPAIEEITDTTPQGPIPAPDGRAALVTVPVSSDLTQERRDTVVEDLRSYLAEDTIADVTPYVTGGPAFAVDTGNSFANANFILLAATVAIVAVLLIVTYRSPLLWLIPLLVVGLADRLADVASTLLSSSTGLFVNPGIVSVLVFGAGTNYALLLISRYREELRRHDSAHTAMATAWQRTIGAIVASNITVAIAMLTLLLAAVPVMRGVGMAAAAGLLIALVVVLTVLPGVLVLFGRRIFWPFIPHQGDEVDHDSGLWARAAGMATRAPRRVLAAFLALVVAGGLALLPLGFGVDRSEQFRTPMESTLGTEALAEHFPTGGNAQAEVIAPADLGDLTAQLEQVPGTDSVQPLAANDSEQAYALTSTVDARTPEAAAWIDDLRDLPGDIAVGGEAAEDVDTERATITDLLLIVPLILLIVVLIVGWLMKSVIAPIVFVAATALSTLAALGIGGLLGSWLFGYSALDLQTPLFAVVFLIALGIDYTIFLTHRIIQRLEDGHDTNSAVVGAVARTGTVITSAGVVLAGVFAALGVLPLITMAQLGVIVCLGVLMDTLIVRTFVIPALCTLLGKRIWWPRTLHTTAE